MKSSVWTIAKADRSGRAAYSEGCGTASFSPSQAPEWIGAWLDHADPDAFFATAVQDGEPVFDMALEVVQQGPFKVARFMGGRHACGNFPPVRADLPQAEAKSLVDALPASIRKARPDIDILLLERLADQIGGRRNPLLSFPTTDSPNIALAVDLDGGFEELLKRASGKRKKKKHRAQMRKFETIGPFRRLEAGSRAEVDRFLDAFFAMKAHRFRGKGITDVFAPDEVKAFFRALFGDALGQSRPKFVLHGLEVDGKLRAITGSSIEGSRLICEFGAIADDDLAGASPGDFLFFENIKEACNHGFDIYDFSVGDEPYKRLWCDLEIRQWDAIVPLSLKGRAFATYLHMQSRAKRTIKNNEALWSLVKTFRKRNAPQRADDPDE